MIELGTPSNASADYCLVYNYYTGVSNPSSCSTPSQGTTGDNGDVLAFLFQDNANSSYFSRTESYTYDALDRLTSGVAVGNNNGYNYNLAYVYDAYGNMTCQVNAQTDGYCPNWTYNGATNQFTMSGFAYDADGNLTSDGSHTYQYDAEGHIISADNGSTATLAYNAMGQEMEAKYNGTQLEFVYDPMGHQVGTYSVSDGRWWDGNVMFGDRALTWTWGNGMQHESAVRTTTMTTLYDGSVAMDELYNPWGSVWAYVGSYYGGNFNGMSGEPEGLNFYHADHRMYTSALSRWMTPDPMGGNVADPQSLNRYAYALNNPTTLTDPSGLDPNGCDNIGSYEGSGSNPFDVPCESAGPGTSYCPYSGACGTSNKPSGPGPVSIDSNGDPLSADIAAGEAAYVTNNCLNCVNVEGNFYGQHVNTTFPNWDAYANWSTTLASSPANQVYDAFWNLLENQGGDPNTVYKVQVYMWGLLPNVGGMGPLVTPSGAGWVNDPYHGTHPGGSYFKVWPPVNTPHCANTGFLGGVCHNDAFSSIWLLPLHELFDVLPSLFINPQNPSSYPKGVVPWKCSAVGGCHP